MKLKIIFSILFFCLYFGFIYPQNVNQQNTTSNIQTQTKINTDFPEIMGLLNTQNFSNAQLKFKPTDRAVDANKYIVGPNDEFILGLYGFLNQQIQLVVNLEGTLIVPTIGEIKVGGLTLAEVKNKVISAVKKRYISSDVSFNLSIPKNFIIYVSALNQKSLEVNSLTRVSDVVSYIYFDTINIQSKQYLQNNTKDFFIPQMSLRNIELIHKNGTKSSIDLYKYFYAREDKDNLYFNEGDFLKIPYGQLDKNYITVEGAIQLSGTYEYNIDDNLETIINISRGFDSNAEQDSILLFRNNPLTSKYEVINLSYSNDKNYKINVFDRIFVKYKSDYIKRISVTVLGEVNRPGIYPVTYKNTKLKDIVELAGGLKSTAYLPLSIVFRKVDEEYYTKDTNEVWINMRTNDLIINDKDRANFERDVLSKRSRMVVDFEKLFNKNDENQNIILEDKDIIYINDDKKIVYVYGQVGNEGYVPYKEGADYEYYIEKAGGFSLAADEGNTRIIKFNSRGWYKPSDTKVMSGDFIYVPKVTPAEFSQIFSIVATTIGIITGLITTYLLIKQNK